MKKGKVIVCVTLAVCAFAGVLATLNKEKTKTPTVQSPIAAKNDPIDNIIIEINAGAKLALRGIKDGNVRAIAPSCWAPPWVYVSEDRYPSTKMDQVPAHPMSENLQNKANNAARAIGEFRKALNEEVEMTKRQATTQPAK